MAQHDYNIANQSGAAFRQDLNNALAAIVSQNSGAAEPSTTYAYQWWADTTAGLLKIRNAANSAWITLRELDGSLTIEDGTVSAPGLAFTDDLNTGIYSPGNDQLAVTTGGVERANFNGSTEVVFNDGGADVDFRIEGDTNPNLFKIDAGLDQVQVANLNGGPLAGARNRLVNADMRIDQRNAGAAVTATVGGVYPVDRWLATEDTDGSYTAQRSTAKPPGHQYSIVCTVTSADTSLTTTQRAGLIQRIEGFNVDDLDFGLSTAKTVTLSFWVNASVAGSYGGSLRNDDLTRSYAFSYTVNATGTWEYKTVTIPGDTAGTWLKDNTVGMQVTFSLGAGPSVSISANSWQSASAFAPTGSVNLLATNGATFYLSGVQLEPGTVATPFERRSYGQELALCQRYYWKTYEPGIAPGSVTTAGQVAGISTPSGGFRIYVPFKVSMRGVPSVTAYSPVTGTAGAYRDSISGTDKTIALNASSAESLVLAESTAASASAAVTFHIAASIEL